MKSIYKNQKAKARILALYDRQLKDLDISFRNLYVQTSFGRTHLIECGDPGNPPLLVFHGGNATTAYNLKYCRFLLPYFHIYAVDTIGHPGKSAETSLSPFGREYGRWAKEVIEKLGYRQMACFGGSFGAGILVKTMCVAPEMISSSVLLVPAAIKNAPSVKSLNMLFPMCMYLLTHSEKWFVRCILPMAVKEENIDGDILTTARCSIDNARIKTIMPQNESAAALRRFKNPVLVMAAEKDCLFPARGVLARAKEVWPGCRRHLLKGRGHINELTEREKQMIIHALRREKNGFPDKNLNERFLFRNILPQEADQAARIEEICFPPNEACSEKMMRERVAKAPELFLVAIDKQSGKIAGFLNGLSTDESIFRDEFFTDADLYDPDGKNVMLLGLDVLPEYRRQGLAREIMSQYLRREHERGRERVLLTCLSSKVKMYEKMGFVDVGIAQSSWGGEQWHEMCQTLKH